MKELYKLIIFIVLLMVGNSAYSAIFKFTDLISFENKLASSSISDQRFLDFENSSAGDLLPSGSSLGGITFHSLIDDEAGGTIDMKVTDQFDTTSGNNYLGLDDPGNFDQFIGGDNFNLSLGGGFNALGLHFITSDPLFAGDILMQTSLDHLFDDPEFFDDPESNSGGPASNSEVTESILDDGGFVYFIGLISTDLTFGAAQIRFDPAADQTFLYTVDDIITAKVPEPSSLMLFLVVLLGNLLWQQPTIKLILRKKS